MQIDSSAMGMGTLNRPYVLWLSDYNTRWERLPYLLELWLINLYRSLFTSIKFIILWSSD